MTHDLHTALQALPPALTQALTPELTDRFEGVISAERFTQLQSLSGLESDPLMLTLLPLAAAYAITPVSHFRVGAIAQGQSGALYFGANLELVQQNLFHSVHGEQAAISNAWRHGESGIRAMVVNASPCGHCRQFMNELQHANQLQVVLPDQGRQALSHYLPYAFGPKDLGVESGLLAHMDHGLQHPSRDPMMIAAVAEANASYAPYSSSPAAVVLQSDDERLFCGRYAENAAFNPSLPPMQMALSAMAMSGVPFHRIRRALLVQKAQGQIDHRLASVAALGAVSDVALQTEAV
ncbi:cytidine deaminase [Ferrimonas gelatinilytica]|uniref:Cytidine deaminase n=1 Tax=Ferrimonas gelatinilytica TaxID=1255257 RepID=A0ABP9RZ26_9GAMM